MVHPTTLIAQQQQPDDEFVFFIEYEGWANAFDIIVYAVFMALAATTLWIAYRTMEHPRLPVIRSDEAPPRATLAGVLRYLLTTFVLVHFWITVLFVLIATVAGDRSAVAILVAASGVIGGSRLLAHIKPEIAHELAKSVPVAILGLIIIGNGFVGFERFTAAVEDLPTNLFRAYATGLVLWDYLLTLIWFVAIRFRWRRRQARTGRRGSGEALPERLWDKYNRIGYGGTRDGDEASDAEADTDEASDAEVRTGEASEPEASHAEASYADADTGDAEEVADPAAQPGVTSAPRND